MHGDDEEPDAPAGAGANAGSRLRVLSGPGGGVPTDPPPPVRLRREFKGLTVADLSRDEVLRRLPGQVRSALAHLERGDLAGAERALPGHFAVVHTFPAVERRRRRRWFVAVGLVAVGLTFALLQAARRWLGL